MKKLVLVLVSILILSSCSFAEPSADVTYIYIPTDNGTWIHALAHEDNGDDEINVSNLSGLLPDDQHVLDVEAISAIENASPLTLPEYTLTGDINTAGYYLDGGNGVINFKTTSNTPFYLETSNDFWSGCNFEMYHKKATPADGDLSAIFYFYGRHDAIGKHEFGQLRIVNVDVSAGSEDGGVEWYLMENGAWNLAMTLSSNGTLAVDDSYGTFDYLDDADVLRKGISEGDTELMREIGVLKTVDIIDIDGKILGTQDMVQLQPFIKLIAGGVYQNRDKIDVLEARIVELEKLIK